MTSSESALLAGPPDTSSFPFGFGPCVADWAWTTAGLATSSVTSMTRATPDPAVSAASRASNARAHCQHFYSSVGSVADPTRNPKDVRLALDKPAKADTLDASADQKAASLRDRVFAGSHWLIAEVRGQIAEVKNSRGRQIWSELDGVHLCNLTSNL